MTFPPPPPPPSWPEPDAEAVLAARRRRLAIWFGGIVGAFVIMVIAVFALTVLRDGDDGPRAAPVEARGHWDPRLAEIAGFVADARDLDWKHPVAVRFEHEEDFVEEITGDDRDPTGDDEELVERSTRTLEALSLLPPGTDLVEAVEEAGAASILAFYDPETEEIVVRGRDLDVERRVIVAHELTHALQDQHFDLERLRHEAADEGNEGAVTSVIEGDAVRIQIEYVASLPAGEQAEYADDLGDTTLAAREHLRAEGVPEIVEVLFAYPYTLGLPFVEIAIAVNGGGAVDQLFVPEITEAEVLTPVLHLEGVEPATPETPLLPDDAEDVEDEEPFGASGWYLVLAARLDPATALAAADGWQGDTSLIYRRDGASCIGVAFAGRTSADTDRMTTALESWVRAGPAGAAEVERRDDDVVLHACEDDSAPGPEHSLTDALAIATTRSTIFWELLSVAPDQDAAWCLANELAFDPQLTSIVTGTDPPTAQDQALITERVQANAASCTPR